MDVNWFLLVMFIGAVLCGTVGILAALYVLGKEDEQE